MPSFSGLSHPFLSGWPRKKGAPRISMPSTEPRLHNCFAPRARLYHSTAAGVSLTASITDITDFCVCVVIVVSLLLTERSRHLFARSDGLRKQLRHRVQALPH